MSVKPILLASCGNALAGDDAFGPAVLRQAAPLAPPGVECIDLGMSPASLLDVLPGRRGLILIDAVLTPWPPDTTAPIGGLLDMDGSRPHQLPIRFEPSHSSHGLGLTGQLQLAFTLELLPRWVRIIALGLESAQIGEGMSPGAQAQITPAALLAVNWARRFLEV